MNQQGLGVLSIAMPLLAFACQPKERPFAKLAPAASDAGPVQAAPGRSDDSESPTTSGTSEGPAVPTSLDPSSMTGSQSSDALGPRTCKKDAGSCQPRDAGALPATCIATGPRDCTSERDNDCDGRPDNIVDDVCRCVVGTIETCDEHPGFDGVGGCKPGTRYCSASPDAGGSASDWGACEGSVAPGIADSCALAGDDADCDGIPNEGCTCVDGTRQQCGSTTDVGVCAFGVSTCVNGAFEGCIGAVPPAPRDSCTPGDDGNCNGIPNEGCTCIDGETRSCGPPTIGACRSGVQTCSNGTFGQCEGAIQAGPRNCNSPADNDCNGQPDNTLDSVCQCAIGSTRACDTHPQDGIGGCRPGEQRCLAGPGNSSSAFSGCSGGIAPALIDSCTPENDANCNGNENDGCDCIVGQGNGPCSNDPNRSRCDGQGQCAPCQVDGDCSLVSDGRSTCGAGVCVAPASPLSCTALGNVRQAPLPPFTESEAAAPVPTGGVIEDGVYVTTQVQFFRVENIGSVVGETIEFSGGTFSRNSTTYSSLSGDALAGATTAGTFVTTGTSLAVEGIACSVGGMPRTAEIWGYSVTGTRLELQRRDGQAGIRVSVFAKQ